jgi:multiple sugar transport system substrate-binding protein
MKRCWLVLLVIVCLAGATVSQAAPQKVKLTFWDNNAGPERNPLFQELIKRFEAKNPNIEVEFVGFPASSAKQKYDVAVAANDLPDCASMPQQWIGDYAGRKVLVPLDSYLKKWAEGKYIAASARSSVRSSAIDKKEYMIPYTGTLDTLWYRSDLLKKAGLEAPQTWDELFNDIEKFTDKANNRYGFSIRGGVGGPYPLQAILYAYSGIPTYFTSKGKCTINDPKHVKIAKRFFGLYGKYTAQGDITNSFKEMTAAFDTGSACMILHNLGSYTQHLQTLGAGKFAAAPLPKAISGKQVFVGGNAFAGFSIFKTTKNKDAAWKLISFMASKDSQSYWNQKIGQMPTHAQVMDDQWVKDSQHISTIASAMLDKKTIVVASPIYLPEYASIMDQVVQPGMQMVMSGQKTVEAFLNDWAHAMEKAKTQYDAVMKK